MLIWVFHSIKEPHQFVHEELSETGIGIVYNHVPQTSSNADAVRIIVPTAEFVHGSPFGIGSRP